MFVASDPSTLQKCMEIVRSIRETEDTIHTDVSAVKGQERGYAQLVNNVKHPTQMVFRTAYESMLLQPGIPKYSESYSR